MVKKGTLASPRPHGRSGSCRAGRADEQHAARNAAAEALEFLRIAQELHDLLQVLLGLVDAGDVVEGDAAMRSVRSLALDLPKPMARPPPDCIWRMKKIHTPISSSIGNQLTSTPRIDGTSSSGGFGRDLHALLVEPLDEARILRRYGREGAALVAVEAGDAVLGDDTSEMLPASMPARNSE
jgi:hypothetical protein